MHVLRDARALRGGAGAEPGDLAAVWGGSAGVGVVGVRSRLRRLLRQRVSRRGREVEASPQRSQRKTSNYKYWGLQFEQPKVMSLVLPVERVLLRRINLWRALHWLTGT